MSPVVHAVQNQMTEWAFNSATVYADAFNEVELDVVVTDPDGAERRVPAFWAGENVWRARYASPKLGRHRYRTECSAPADIGLHGREGAVEVRAYTGQNPLLRHGPLRVSGNRRHLEHADGKPFFWLGDTWWMGLCRRLEWPDDFQRLTADRAGKGFTVVQIVAGLYPDMDAFDPRGANEAGFAWESGYARINPAYFDMADLRMAHLVRNGLLPCIVGCWGYFLPWMGMEKMQRHWRYLVARWGAYPVAWCLAGEGQMPYYLSRNREADEALQRRGWTAMGAYLRKIDPYDRPVTIHPGTAAHRIVEDPDVLDFDMLQTGHGDRRSLPNTVRLVVEGRAFEPRMPVINGEVCYEGIGEQCREEVQRLMFWACMLSGACGHTYGANGVWQVNRRGEPYGPSPHGSCWGNRPWDEAAQLPGSTQLGLAKRLLERYAWWRFEPHPEWAEPRWTEADYLLPYAAGIPGEIRVIYYPLSSWIRKVKDLETGLRYRAFLFNPSDATEIELGEAQGDAHGDWPLSLSCIPIYRDWVLVLETPGARQHVRGDCVDSAGVE